MEAPERGPSAKDTRAKEPVDAFGGAGTARAPTSSNAAAAASLHGVDAGDSLTRTQRTVLTTMQALAEKRSVASYELTLARLAGFGISKADVDLALENLKTAKIQIHFNPEKALVISEMPVNQRGPVPADPPKLDYKVKVDRSQRVIDAYLQDDRFRNQFETGITDGSPTAFPGGRRDGWERTFFQGLYHQGAFNPDERPKYAALNPTDRPNGMASQYGACYFELKPHVRERVTITPRNTSWCTEDMLGTLEHAAHVLFNMEPAYVKAIAHGDKEHAGDWLYMEAQVHGAIEFAKDIERLSADAKYKGTPYQAKLETFCANNGIALAWRT